MLDTQRLKRTWIHWIWRASYRIWMRVPPEQVSLCQYVRRLAASIVIIPAGVVVVGGCFTLLLIANLLYIPWKLILGYRPSSEPPDFVRYRTLKVRGFSIYPVHVIVAITTVLLVRWGASNPNVGKLASSFLHSPWGYYILMPAAILLCVAIMLRVGGAMDRYWESDSRQLLKAWIKAKKDKICPILDFSDSPKKTN